MKITKSQLKQYIKEETALLREENWQDPYFKINDTSTPGDGAGEYRSFKDAIEAAGDMAKGRAGSEAKIYYWKQTWDLDRGRVVDPVHIGTYFPIQGGHQSNFEPTAEGEGLYRAYEHEHITGAPDDENGWARDIQVGESLKAAPRRQGTNIMKVTKSQLKQYIKEELQNVLRESDDPRFLARSKEMGVRSLSDRRRETDAIQAATVQRLHGEPVSVDPTKRSEKELGERAIELGLGWGLGSDRRYATTRWFITETPPGIATEEEAKDWLSDNVRWYNRFWGDLGYDSESDTWITTRELDTTG